MAIRAMVLTLFYPDNNVMIFSILDVAFGIADKVGSEPSHQPSNASKTIKTAAQTKYGAGKGHNDDNTQGHTLKLKHPAPPEFIAQTAADHIYQGLTASHKGLFAPYSLRR